MSKEPMIIEGQVNSIQKDEKGNDWITINWHRPLETKEAEPGASAQVFPTEYCSINLLMSSLPGVKYGDKVELAISLK